MAAKKHKGSWWPVGPVLWDENGNPYRETSDGLVTYIPPIAAAQYQDDPRMLEWAKAQGWELQRDEQGNITGMTQGEGASGNKPLDFRTGRQWDSLTGGYKTKFDWGDVVTAGVGGLLGVGAAAAIGGALGGGGAATAAGSAGSAGAGGAGAAGGAAGSGIGLGAGSTAGGLTGATGAGIGLGTGSTAGGLGGATGAGIGLGTGSTAGGLGGAAGAAGLGGTVGGSSGAAGTTGASGASAGSGMNLGMGDYLGIAGGALEGASEGKAEQRSATATAMRDQEYLRQTQERMYFDSLLAKEQDKREAGNDAWKRLQYADFVGNYGDQSRLGNLSLYSRPVQGPSDQMRAAANDPLMLEMLKRQANGTYDPYGGATPTRAPDFTTWNQNLKPGKGEQWMGWIGGALKGLGGAWG